MSWGPGCSRHHGGRGGILFLTFKQSYVRGDNQHAITAATALVLIALACLAVAVTRNNGFIIIAAAAVFCACGGFTSFMPERQNLRQSFFHQLGQTLSPGNLMSPILCLTTRNMSESWESLRLRLRQQASLPPVAGGVDLYSTGQNYLFASGLAYRPRPIIQSYSAYTPELARLNADWLRSGQAAPNLYFAIQPVDGLSWPELLTRYDVKGVSDKHQTYLRLSRSPAPRKYRLELLKEMTITCGKTVVLPLTNNLIWAEMEIKKSFVGELFSVFYKPSVLEANVKLADRTSHICRIIPGMARAGFLLSPFVSNNGTFLGLAVGDEAALAAQRVVAITVFEEGSPADSFSYQPEIKIRFYRLDFPAQTTLRPTPGVLLNGGRVTE